MSAGGGEEVKHGEGLRGGEEEDGSDKERTSEERRGNREERRDIRQQGFIYELKMQRKRETHTGSTFVFTPTPLYSICCKQWR